MVQRWAPLEAKKAGWECRPVPDDIYGRDFEREHLEVQHKRKEDVAAKSFVVQRQENLLHLTAVSETTSTVIEHDFQIPRGPLPDIDELRETLRDMIAQQEESQPFMAMIKGRLEEGWFLVCYNSYLEKDYTVRVLRANDTRQVENKRISWTDLVNVRSANQGLRAEGSEPEIPETGLDDREDFLPGPPVGAPFGGGASSSRMAPSMPRQPPQAYSASAWD